MAAAEEEEEEEVKLEYLEVKCTSSGETRRFAPGTDAGFAVSVINRKLIHMNLKRKSPLPLALHIEASDFNSEPISFGPNSPLINYGHAWLLHTVLADSSSSGGVGDDDIHKYNRKRAVPPTGDPPPVNVNVSESSVPTTKVTKPAAISLVYIGKIILVFILLFVLGAIFTLALENLPLLISFLTSSL